MCSDDNSSHHERLSSENDLIKNFKSFFKRKNESTDNISSNENDFTKYKENYQIAICQDGKFVVTFDTANLRIKILENTDHRQFRTTSQRNSEFQKDDEINKTVAFFKINDDLDIDYLYDPTYLPKPFVAKKNNDFLSADITTEGSGSGATEDELKEKFRWSLGISNVQNHHVDKCFIFVAISRISVEEDMKGTKSNDTNYRTSRVEKRKFRSVNSIIDIKSEPKRTVIYRLKLREENENYVLKKYTVTYYYSDSVSGICRFVEDLPNLITNNIKKEIHFLKRFIVLNINGIYNFEYNDDYKTFDLNERFDYPKSIENELEHWHNENLKDCMDRLLTCLYNQYFLVEQYKNNVQALEVYDLAEMKLKITPKRVERKDKYIRKYNHNTFSISRQTLCFTRGINSIKLYLIENGLEVVSKKFHEVEKINSLEFIDSDEKLLIIAEGQDKVPKIMVWDLYKTGKVESIILDNFLAIKDFNTCLARTSGNFLQVDDKGKVTSVLKKVENSLRNLKQNQPGINTHLKACSGEKLEGKHIIHFNKIVNRNFKAIVDEKEPWVIDDYERNSYCLCDNEKETLQLIVGRSTVQIWHQVHPGPAGIKKDFLPNRGGPFLEYIWTNGIPVNQEREETRLQVEVFRCGTNDFYLKVYWYERDSKSNSEKIKENKENEKEIINEENEVIKNMRKEETKGNGIVKRKEKIIRQQDIKEKVSTVRHACKALEHLNKRRNFLATNYIKIHKYEEMVMYIQHIVWRFAKHKPIQYRLLDVRHNVMKNLILGDCSHLIKYILFGDRENYRENVNEEEFEIRHIPRSISWPGKEFIKDHDLDNNKLDDERIKPENDMELAIYRYKGCELKDTIIVAYLLEYYSKHATNYAGWMSTVSKALPLLFKYNYDDYARKLFRKECFADQDYFSAQDPYGIIPKKYQAKRNHDIKFRAFRIDKLKSDKYKWYNGIWNFFELFKKTYKFFEDFDNDLERSPIALRVVPLPDFTINSIPQKKVENNLRRMISNALLIIFIPRRYKIRRNQKNLLSPFSRVVQYENNDDMYDNPATEAVIDFRWRKARNFFFLLFLRFLIFACCFVLVSWEYLVHEYISEGYQTFLVALIIIFYYLAIYLLTTEFTQLYYHGPRKYFADIFNSFDIFSIVLPVIVMSILLKNFHFSDGFGNVETVDTGLIVGISFSIFLLWIELISYLRLISKIAIYIYYVIYIFRNIFPFLLFIIIVVIAFAHTMFVLLKDPKNIDTKNSTSSGVATNALTNETFNIRLQSDFNATDRSDNPFSSFLTAIEAAYFWINGNWILKDQFDFWAIDAFTLIASVFLVTILQNMLIAFMGGVYEKAETKGRQALLRFRANQIADYEALHHILFWPPEPESEPNYIYYIGQSKNFEEWYKRRKDDQGEIYKDFEEKSTFTKFTFKESSYDKISIWKLNVKPLIRGPKRENSISISMPEEKVQEVVTKEIEEINILKDDINSFIENKLNIQDDDDDVV